MENFIEYKLDAWLEIQMKITPGFKQVNFTKTITTYLTSTDKIRGEEA